MLGAACVRPPQRCWLTPCVCQVGFLRKGTEIAESFDAEEMQRNFLRVRLRMRRCFSASC